VRRRAIAEVTVAGLVLAVSAVLTGTGLEGHR
jgi:hypothetical protein